MLFDIIMYFFMEYNLLGMRFGKFLLLLLRRKILFCIFFSLLYEYLLRIVFNWQCFYLIGILSIIGRILK